MRFEILVALAVFISAIFFAIGYALDIGRASNITPQYTYIDVIYFFGALFFLVYSALNFYMVVKFPRQTTDQTKSWIDYFVSLIKR